MKPWNGVRGWGVGAIALAAGLGLCAAAGTSDSQDLQRKRDTGTAAAFDGAGDAGPAGRDLSVTVYNDNLGLVKDRRTVSVDRGRSEFSFTGVAAQLDPTSVHIRAMGNGSIDVASQEYRNDFASTDRLLQRYLNRAIEVRMKGNDVRRGTLVSFDPTSLVLQASGGLSVLTRTEAQEIALTSSGGDVAAGPTLVWRVNSSNGRSVPVEVSYLTGGLTWHAEYVAVQDEGGGTMDLQGWATVENSSGESYENARVKLIAGAVHRASGPRPPMPYETMMRADAGMAAQKLSERGFDEYHLYELPDRATIANNEVKQLGLMRARGVTTTRKYVYDAEKNTDQVMTTLEFQNEASAGIGIPLPAGLVRVYQRDADGALEFTGEDRIQHTAKNETARVAVGGVFDVAVERKQTEFKQISRAESEYTVEITLRNHRTKPIDVTVVEHAYGDWEIVQSSLPATKKDATKFEFSARCAPERPTTVSYTLRTRVPGVEPR